MINGAIDPDKKEKSQMATFMTWLKTQGAADNAEGRRKSNVAAQLSERNTSRSTWCGRIVRKRIRSRGTSLRLAGSPLRKNDFGMVPL